MMYFSEISWQWYELVLLIVAYIVSVEIFYLYMISTDTRDYGKGIAERQMTSNKIMSMMCGIMAVMVLGAAYTVWRAMEPEDWPRIISIAEAGAVCVSIGWIYMKANQWIGKKWIERQAKKRR